MGNPADWRGHHVSFCAGGELVHFQKHWQAHVNGGEAVMRAHGAAASLDKNSFIRRFCLHR
jgi:hypothetical protein